MKKINIYSKYNLILIQVISLITLLLISATTAKKIYSLVISDFYSAFPASMKALSLFSIFKNLVIIVFSAILIKFPYKFLLICIECLFYSLYMTILGSESFFSLAMLCVAFSTFLIQINFRKIKKATLIIFIILYLFELFLPLKNGFTSFYATFGNKIGLSILLGFLIFFVFEYAKQIGVNQSTNKKILNLALYQDLERSDMLLLQLVLDNVKYKDIAQKIHGSEGALRNKLSKIYKILEVGDRTGFVTIYYGYELIYNPQPLKTSTN